MASIPSEELNPFRAPGATIGYQNPSGAAGADAELIRRTYLTHEGAIKIIGFLQYIGAAALGVGTIGLIIATIAMFMGGTNAANAQVDPRLLMGVGAVAMLIGTIVVGALGYGLRHLQPWARWVTLVLNSLSLLIQVVQTLIGLVGAPSMAIILLFSGAIGSIIPGYLVYLMASSKGAMVFSPEYREVVRATPYIKYRVSMIVKVLFFLLLGIILLAAVGGIIAGISGR